MKKIGKKTLVLMLVLMLFSMCFAGCKKKSKCWNCEEMKYCEPFNDYTLGELNLCKDCKKMIEPMSKKFEQFFEGSQQ